MSSRTFGDPWSSMLADPWGGMGGYGYGGSPYAMLTAGDYPYEYGRGSGQERGMEQAGGESSGEGRQIMTRPRCDVWEDTDSYRIRADMPGMTKDNVKVEMKGDTLTIRGDVQKEEEQSGVNWHRRERRRGTYMRSFTVPEGTSPDQIDAQFTNGVLDVKIPKPAPAAGGEAESRSITIK